MVYPIDIYTVGGIPLKMKMKNITWLLKLVYDVEGFSVHQVHWHGIYWLLVGSKGHLSSFDMKEYLHQ